MQREKLYNFHNTALLIIVLFLSKSTQSEQLGQYKANPFLPKMAFLPTSTFACLEFDRFWKKKAPL
jgi:hypothetical protein